MSQLFIPSSPRILDKVNCYTKRCQLPSLPEWHWVEASQDKVNGKIESRTALTIPQADHVSGYRTTRTSWLFVQWNSLPTACVRSCTLRAVPEYVGSPSIQKTEEAFNCRLKLQGSKLRKAPVGFAKPVCPFARMKSDGFARYWIFGVFTKVCR